MDNIIVFRELVVNTPKKDLIQLCRTNKSFFELCQDNKQFIKREMDKRKFYILRKITVETVMVQVGTNKLVVVVEVQDSR
jgi:hypothetical protein